MISIEARPRIPSLATDHPLRDRGFTESGREWLSTVVTGLRTKLAENSPANSGPAPGETTR